MSTPVAFLGIVMYTYRKVCSSHLLYIVWDSQTEELTTRHGTVSGHVTVYVCNELIECAGYPLLWNGFGTVVSPRDGIRTCKGRVVSACL